MDINNVDAVVKALNEAKAGMTGDRLEKSSSKAIRVSGGGMAKP